MMMMLKSSHRAVTLWVGYDYDDCDGTFDEDDSHRAVILWVDYEDCDVITCDDDDELWISEEIAMMINCVLKVKSSHRAVTLWVGYDDFDVIRCDNDDEFCMIEEFPPCRHTLGQLWLW